MDGKTVKKSREAILRKVEVNGYCLYWGQKGTREGLLGCCLCSVSWSELLCGCLLYYSNCTYVLGILCIWYISQLKRKRKSLRHVTTKGYSIRQYCGESKEWFAGNLTASCWSSSRVSPFHSPGWVSNWQLSSSQHGTSLARHVGGGRGSCRDHQQTSLWTGSWVAKWEKSMSLNLGIKNVDLGVRRSWV